MIKGNFYTHCVWIDGKQLLPDVSQKVWNHSPDGFAWGYSGSGPAQLALALLLYFTSDENYSLAHYQDFKWDIIAKLPQKDFNIGSDIVQTWVDFHP